MTVVTVVTKKWHTHISNTHTMKNITHKTPKGWALMRPLSKKKTQFGNLAMRYYPGRGYKRAVHLFRQELEHTRGLLEALQDVDYRPQ